MSADNYTPPAELIDRLVEKHDRRQLAIAYLRAQRRARSNELAFNVISDLTKAEVAAKNGDIKTVINNLERAVKRMQTSRQVEEKPDVAKP